MEIKDNMFNLVDLIPIFSDLNDEKKALIQNIIIEKNVKKGTILFLENEPVKAIYFLKKGKVRLSKSNPNGKEIIIGIRRAGDLFPKVTLFRNSNYPATAEMLEDGEYICLANSDLEQLISLNPEIGIAIIKIMGERLSEAQNKLRNVALYGKLGALAATLLSLTEQYGIKTDKGIKIDLYLTHQELSNFIGAARENVNRMVSLLEKDDVLIMNRGEMIIKDLDALKAYIC